VVELWPHSLKRVLPDHPLTGKMCESHAYLLKGDQEELFLENVDKVQPQDDGQLVLEDIFGRRKMIKARIKELALVDHKIILEEV